MSPIAPALDRLCAEVAETTARHGRRVEPAGLGVLDRQGHLPLDPPGRVSPNRACRLIRAADGWIALNLAREEDQGLVAALLGSDVDGDVWAAIEAHAPGRSAAELADGGALLGLPLARVGEIACDTFDPPQLRLASPGSERRRSPLQVVDLSALWAGPMCGAILAAMGASVRKVESQRRPDPTRSSTPAFFARLNGRKSLLAFDFGAEAGRGRLRDEVLATDILITSARPRAFAGLGLDPQVIFAANPSLVWVAITGYGWTGESAQRVAFGDDAAAGGGLVGWTAEGEPRFLGDALADPVTGLAAAIGALAALEAGGGVLVDVAMARCAAAAASICELRAAA